VVLVSLRGGSSSAGFTNQTKKNRGRRFSSGSAPAAAGTYQSPPAEYVGPPPPLSQDGPATVYGVGYTCAGKGILRVPSSNFKVKVCFLLLEVSSGWEVWFGVRCLAGLFSHLLPAADVTGLARLPSKKKVCVCVCV